MPGLPRQRKISENCNQCWQNQYDFWIGIEIIETNLPSLDLMPLLVQYLETYPHSFLEAFDSPLEVELPVEEASPVQEASYSDFVLNNKHIQYSMLFTTNGILTHCFLPRINSLLLARIINIVTTTRIAWKAGSIL